MKTVGVLAIGLMGKPIKIISLRRDKRKGGGDPLHLFPIPSPLGPQRERDVLADNRQTIEMNRDAMHFIKISLANFLRHAKFDLGMNLSLAAKRMATSTSSIISTSTKSITANGEARN